MADYNPEVTPLLSPTTAISSSFSSELQEEGAVTQWDADLSRSAIIILHDVQSCCPMLAIGYYIQLQEQRNKNDMITYMYSRNMLTTATVLYCMHVQ